MTNLFEKLSKPFPAQEIQWRVGATREKDGKITGLALAYYDARALYDRLDEACGFENWQIRYPHANGKTCAEIGIRINNEWVWKANGAGDSQTEAEKGAFSDAAKRAGVPWGIGRYLYEMTDTWVECEKRGKSTIIKKTEYAKLNRAYENFVKTGVKPNFTAPEDEVDFSPTNKAPPVNEQEMTIIVDLLKDARSPLEFQSARDKATAAKHRMTPEQIAKIGSEILARTKDFPLAPTQAKPNGTVVHA